MSYLRDKKHNIKKVVFISIFIAFLVYVVLFTQFFGSISRGVGFVAVPVWKAQGTAASIWDNLYAVFVSKKTLIEENKKLREDVAISGAKLLDRNLLLEENAELKELLGRDVTTQNVFSVVLTKPNRSLYDTIVIDVGENAGVKKGDRVLYGGTIVIGKVAEVLKNSSKVLLSSSPGEKIDVMVGSNSIETTAYGRGGGSFELELPRDMDVAIGDAITVSGIAPRVLGVVEHIETEPSSPTKTILFKGPVDIFKLKWVEVIIK
jgi:rod shape-determining protein MreC